jgi:hypothetical protein
LHVFIGSLNPLQQASIIVNHHCKTSLLTIVIVAINWPWISTIEMSRYNEEVKCSKQSMSWPLNFSSLHTNGHNKQIQCENYNFLNPSCFIHKQKKISKCNVSICIFWIQVCAIGIWGYAFLVHPSFIHINKQNKPMQCDQMFHNISKNIYNLLIATNQWRYSN